MTAQFAGVNGVNIAYSAQGNGPPLVLIMGYRLNSTAWPATFIAQLAQLTDLREPELGPYFFFHR